jgi:class 3 adenylate cyclase
MRRAEHGRALRAVVFLDTVDSTKIAATLGDERWQVLLRRELQILRKLLKARGGEEVDVAGDGLFALFREPAPAVRFAASACEAVREIGLEIRAGVHFGEVEFADGRPAGIVVHTGARAMGLAGAGEVMVTQGVRDLLTGGHLGFESQGAHELKGVPGAWTLFRLIEVDGEAIAPPLDDDEADTRRHEESIPASFVSRRTFVVGVGAAAVVLSFGTYLLTRDDEARPNVLADRLLRFDPRKRSLVPSPVVLPSLFFGAELPSLIAGEGAVWAGDRTGLHQIDPADGSLRRNIPTGSVVAMSIGFDDVWVAGGESVARIDPGDGEILTHHELTSAGPGNITGVLTAFGDVWVGFDSGRLVRLLPTQGLPVSADFIVGDLPTDLTQSADAVWVADSFGRLIRVDPRTNRTRRIDLGGTPEAIAASEDDLWVAEASGVVHVIDPMRGALRRSIPIGGQPVDIATGLDAVWVADQEGQLVWIDPIDLEVKGRKPLEGQHPAAIAVDRDAGVVWIRTFSGAPSP